VGGRGYTPAPLHRPEEAPGFSDRMFGSRVGLIEIEIELVGDVGARGG